jgi:hypothetical protein
MQILLYLSGSAVHATAVRGIARLVLFSSATSARMSLRDETRTCVCAQVRAPAFGHPFASIPLTDPWCDRRHPHMLLVSSRFQEKSPLDIIVPFAAFDNGNTRLNRKNVSGRDHTLEAQVRFFNQGLKLLSCSLLSSDDG